MMSQKVGLVGLLKTKLKAGRFAEVQRTMLQLWCITTNFSRIKGGRILVAWLQDFFEVDVVCTENQFIHMKVLNKAVNQMFEMTVVYGSNDSKERIKLWQGLKQIGRDCKGPWLITCDFNAPLCYEDRIGRAISHTEIKDFEDCV